ncbi:MAG: CopG family transcriptional regulator [Cytophagales bacterium]|nr:CopG family transcriptional regulator [Cytophagales bacterium]
MTASEFDKAFEEGDIIQHLDLSQVNRPGLQPRRVSVDFPEWMVGQLDMVAKRLGVTRQSVIKVYISEKLKEDNL